MEVTFEQAMSVCRGCLTTDRRMVDAKSFEAVFRDVTGITISSSDGFPQSLCYECSALLWKCVNFKSKVIKSHDLLCQYVHKNIPCPYEENASPHLTRSQIFYYEVTGTNAEQIEEQTNLKDGKVEKKLVIEVPLMLKTENVNVKNEPVCFGDQDNMTMEECDAFVRETAALITQGRDTTTSDKVGVKYEETKSSSDDDRDELLENYDIFADCDQIDDRSNSISPHSDFNDEQVEDTNDSVNSSSHDNVKTFMCDRCGRCLKSKTRLTEHIRVHLVDRPFKCDECTKSYPTRTCLKKHKRTHTGNKPYKCDVCTKSFYDVHQLKRHKRFHTGDRRYHCNICEKGFYTNMELTEHKRLHTGEKPYQCELCGRSFSKKEYFRKHKKMHTGEKNYKCDLCTKRFSLKQTLINHRRTHTGEKPYKCDVCMRGFNQKNNLDIHYRVHTGEKPFQCDVCLKCFTVKQHLKKHSAIHNRQWFVTVQV